MRQNILSEIDNERERQIVLKGYSSKSDDRYISGELAGAAACYAQHANARGWVYDSDPAAYQSELESSSWPWDWTYWKPKSPREDLIRAAALIVAEIERLDRLSKVVYETYSTE